MSARALVRALVIVIALSLLAANLLALTVAFWESSQ